MEWMNEFNDTPAQKYSLLSVRQKVFIWKKQVHGWTDEWLDKRMDR